MLCRPFCWLWRHDHHELQLVTSLMLYWMWQVAGVVMSVHTRHQLVTSREQQRLDSSWWRHDVIEASTCPVTNKQTTYIQVIIAHVVQCFTADWCSAFCKKMFMPVYTFPVALLFDVTSRSTRHGEVRQALRRVSRDCRAQQLMTSRRLWGRNLSCNKQTDYM